MKPIVIIGAGIGGLSAAIRLAAAGEKVLVLEKNPQVGGKMSEVQAAGYRWDTGPSVITMRHVFEELFRDAGRRMEDYLKLLPVEPLTRYFYPDGTRLDASRDLSTWLRQIETRWPRDVAGYMNYLAYAAEIHRVAGPVFIYDQPPSLTSFAKVPPSDYFKVDPLRSMQGAINHYVHSPHLRQLLGRFATYVGASPYLAPATLNVVAYVEMAGGVWYPQGGIYSIAQALKRLAGELGVEIRCNTTVHQIQVEQGRASGVVTLERENIPARAVIANLDATLVYERLLPAGVIPTRALRSLQQRQPSCSGFVLLLGVEGQHSELAHHNIFFCQDYRREFDDIFQRGIPPEEPTIYAAITSKTDPTHAPQGCENWFVLVNAPSLSPTFDWSSNARRYRDQVLQRLAGFGFDLQPRIRYEHILTPVDLERMSGARGGALYGASSNDRFAAFLRPRNRSPYLHGLYLAGGTTHPGGGVPMVTLSGKVAAEMVLNDLHGN